MKHQFCHFETNRHVNNFGMLEVSSDQPRGVGAKPITGNVGISLLLIKLKKSIHQ